LLDIRTVVPHMKMACGYAMISTSVPALLGIPAFNKNKHALKHYFRVFSK